MASRNVPLQKLTQTIDYEINNEVLATCNSIGYFEEGVYIKEPDCNACLKDLIRFLRTDNCHTFAIRRQLGSSNLIANDLMPIMKQHCVQDNELFDLVLRLLVSLTNPALLLFKEEMPTERDQKKVYLELIDHLFAYKQSLAYDVKFWSVVAKHLLRILQISNDKREEEDKIMFERILILLRNVLHVPSQDEPEVVYGDDNVHDKLVVALKLAGLFDIFLHICQTPEEHDFCFHILEIFSLLYKEQDAETLAKHSNSIKTCESERKNDVREMKELLARDKSRFSNSASKSFDRFKGSTYVVRNYKVIGDRDLICHKTIKDVSEISFDGDKKVQRKARNRQHMKDAEHISNASKRSHCSSFEVKRYLRDLASAFLNDSYNLFMKRVRYYLERSTSADNDETYYLWASNFFMEFNRYAGASCELIKETLTAEFIHYLHCLIELHLDRVKTDKKVFAQWSKRLHYGVKSYREVLFTVASVHQEHRYEAYEAANEITRKIFYEQEHRELLRTLLLVYDPIKMSDGYLNDLIEANHVFLKLFEFYAKKNQTLIVNRKKRKAKRKLKKKQDKEAERLANQPWSEIVDQMREALEQQDELNEISASDKEFSDCFDLLSTKSKDDQKMNVMRKLNRMMRNQEVHKSVCLYRVARSFFLNNEDFDDDYAFGKPGISKEEELIALEEIYLNEFLIENNQAQSDADDADDVNAEDEEQEDENDGKRFEYHEEQLNFSDFIKTYATPRIIYPFCLSLKNYEYNSLRTNSYIVKMFHRLAFDCAMYAQFFQLSILRTFQKVMNKHSDNDCYKELVRFAQFIVQKLLLVAAKNDKTFIEILYWKNTKEAYELEEGYNSTKPEKSKKEGKKRSKHSTEKDNLSDLEPDLNEERLDHDKNNDDDGVDDVNQTKSANKSSKRKEKRNKKRKSNPNATFGDDDFASEDSSSDNDNPATSAYDRLFGKKANLSDDDSNNELLSNEKNASSIEKSTVEPKSNGFDQKTSNQESDSSDSSNDAFENKSKSNQQRRRRLIQMDSDDDDQETENTNKDKGGDVKSNSFDSSSNERPEVEQKTQSNSSQNQSHPTIESDNEDLEKSSNKSNEEESKLTCAVENLDESSQESLINQRKMLANNRSKAIVSSDEED